MDVKSKQLSPKQKETLVDFVYARPEMYKGKLTATYTKAISVLLWKEVLNAMPEGATKDWKQWRKTWTDIKKNVKCRMSKEKKHSQGTGGGPPMSPPNDTEKSIEEKIVEIITPVAIQGNEEVTESQCIFEFEDPRSTNEIEEVEYPVQDWNVDHIECEETEGIYVGIDHTYSTVPSPKTTPSGKAEKVAIKENMAPRKRYTKTTRLMDSIGNNKQFLEISQKGILSTDSYREKKLQLITTQNDMKKDYYKKKLEGKEKYYQKKIEILNEVSNSLNRIAAVCETVKHSIPEKALGLM